MSFRQDTINAVTFCIWEHRGNAEVDTLRVINNFRANEANDYAFMPEKLHYDGFVHLQDSAKAYTEKTGHRLRMGKADFKSAFKTLPASKEQDWLCWSLVWNPKLERLQAIRLHTQAFGSLGGVVAWYRTAKLIQTIMLELFDIIVFAYVDDFFWVVPHLPDDQGDLAQFVLETFKTVVTDLLGWDLDPEKEHTGHEMLLLGVDVGMHEGFSRWKFNSAKASSWIQEFEEVLHNDYLSPAMASKFCGRIAFLNSTVCNRLGRALIRPLIWRQLQKYGRHNITRRLRCAIMWFVSVLKANLGRDIPFSSPSTTSKVILYSDAEGNGGVAAVAIRGSTKIFMRGTIPGRVRRMLAARIVKERV